MAPSDKLLIAGIGAGGKGESDLWNFYNGGKAEIAFLCDVDEKRAAKNRERFPKAKFYHDYREMLDKERVFVPFLFVEFSEFLLAQRVIVWAHFSGNVRFIYGN